MKKLLRLCKWSALTTILLLQAVNAHEFWLQPQQFHFNRGELANIRFRVGEHFEGENWRGNRSRIQQLTLHYGNVTDDLSPQVSHHEGDSIQFSIFEEGTVVVAFQSTNSFIELAPEKFKAYLEEDGLQQALDFRQANNETDSAGREYYQRSVKTLLQYGTLATHTYRAATRLPLDLMPLVHPYQTNTGDTMRLRVLFREQPLAGVKLRTWHRLAGTVTEATWYTNAAGEVSFPFSRTGEWMASCVHMIRLTNDPQAAWQSYWGSITWGYTGKAVQQERSR